MASLVGVLAVGRATSSSQATQTYSSRPTGSLDLHSFGAFLLSVNQDSRALPPYPTVFQEAQPGRPYSAPVVVTSPVAPLPHLITSPGPPLAATSASRASRGLKPHVGALAPGFYARRRSARADRPPWRWLRTLVAGYRLIHESVPRCAAFIRACEACECKEDGAETTFVSSSAARPCGRGVRDAGGQAPGGAIRRAR